MMISTMKVLLFFYIFASVEIQARILLEHSDESKIKPFYGRAPSKPPPPSPASAPPREEISSLSRAAEKGLESFLSMVTSKNEQIWSSSSSLPCAAESSCKKGIDVTNYGRVSPSPPPAPHHAPPHIPLFGSGRVASAQSPPNAFLAST